MVGDAIDRRETTTMTGHHPWDELMKKHYTPEERKRMLQEALGELEEDERRRGSQEAAPGGDGAAAGVRSTATGQGQVG